MPDALVTVLVAIGAFVLGGAVVAVFAILALKRDDQEKERLLRLLGAVTEDVH